MQDHIIITLDHNSDISLQAQIRQSVVEAILARAILPGDKLPSSRSLAKQLKVSRNTVILAYQALVDTEYLKPRERSGYMVSEDAPVAQLTQLASDRLERGNAVDSVIDWGSKLVQSCSDLHPVQKPLNWREYPYPFIYGQVDNELFPMSEWRDCARQA